MDNKPDQTPNARLPESLAIDANADPTGFNAFLHGQLRHLLQFLRARTASEQDAEDAVQESMIKMLRYRDTEPSSAWRQLLYRIAVNVAHDQHRVAVTHRTSHHVSLEKVDVVATEASPEQRAVYEQQVARLTQAIQLLPPKCQRVYLLKRVHGLSRAQIAQRCGISVKMVEKHLATALVQLRRNVGDWFTETL